MSEEKKSGKSWLGVLVLLSGLGLLFYFAWTNGFFGKEEKELPKKEPVQEELKEIEDADIYGFALLSNPVSGDSLTKEYKIMELHKTKDNVLLATYVKNNRVGDQVINRVGGLQLRGDQLYYQLYYNLEDTGILAYSELMKIDLSKKDHSPISVLNLGKTEYSKTISKYFVVGPYVYYTNFDDEFFQYDTIEDMIRAKSIAPEFYYDQEADVVLYRNFFEEWFTDDWKHGSVKKITYEEAVPVIEKINQQNREASLLETFYLNGKEIKLDPDHQNLFYDGELIYSTTPGNRLELGYSEGNRIFFSEGSTCTDVGCMEVQSYQYDVITHSKTKVNQQNVEIETFFHL